MLIPCGWCDSLMSSLFRDPSIISLWPSAISCRAPPTPRNKEYQAFVYPATPRHPLLQARCEIFTKLTRLIIIEVFVSRPVRPVMTDSAEHCPTHLSHLRPPGVATGWRYHLRPSRVLSWQFKSVLYPLNVNIITDIPRQQYLSLLWECLSQIVWVSEERNLCSGKINCSSRFLLFLYILLNLCKNNGRKISRKKE